MLLSFSISNFRSFREEQTLSLVASNRYDDHLNHLCPIPEDDNKLLAVAAIYGANGAGKSNLVRALSFLENLVLRGTEPKKPIGRPAFRFDTSSSKKPTELSIQFIEDGRVYAYGTRFGDRFIEAEWLSVLRNEREVIAFERIAIENGGVEIKAGPALEEDTWGNHSKVVALTKVGVLPNQLFLHAVGTGLQERDQGPIMAGVWKWFSERLTIIPPEATFGDLAGLVDGDTAFTDFAGDFLKRVATGVDRLKVETLEVDEKMLVGLRESLREVISELPEGYTTVIPSFDGSQLLVEKGEGAKVKLRTVQSEHLTETGARIIMPFSEESDGTQRLTHLLPALHSIKNKPGVFLIDEIDRSLHPLLAKGFVRAFLAGCAEKGSQLIFTTHETGFLDLDLLRRDEIWFADKKRPEGTTELYSLSDFKVRTDLKIDKAYAQGRFEAIPPIEAELPGWVQEIIKEVHPQVIQGAESQP